MRRCHICTLVVWITYSVLKTQSRVEKRSAGRAAIRLYRLSKAEVMTDLCHDMLLKQSYLAG